ncbi:MAG: AsmA family protein [Litoreibacter sp.]
MRWILRIALTLLTLVVLAVAALFLIPTDRIARIAEAQFLDNTGRVLSIQGEVSPQIFPRLGVVLGDVTIANAEWAGSEPMVETARMEVGVGLSALMGGEVIVEAFEIESPVIRLRTNAEGVGNWDFGSVDDTSDDESGGLADFSLPKGTIRDGTLIYVDDATNQSYSLTELNAELALADLQGTADVALTAKLQGQPIEATLRLDGVQQLMDGGVQNVDVQTVIAGNAISFDGAAGLEPLQVKGAIDVDLANLAGIMSLAGQETPVIPLGLGQHPKVAGDLTFSSEGEVFLRNATINLDQNQLRGDIDLKMSDVPFVTAQLVAGDLDFSAMSTDTTAGDGAANAGAGGWSDARLDASGVSAANGAFSIQASSIDLGSIQLGKTAIKGTLDNSRMVLDLGGVQAFGGSVAGQFVVNNRNGLSVGADLNANGLAMQQLMNDFVGFDRLVGQAAMRIQFLGVGETMNQIMNSLSGSGSLDVGAGELLGLDIGGMLRNLDLSYQGEGSKTVFNDITATFTMDGGILSNKDLNFVSEFLQASGAGSMDLGGQTIDYKVEPVALASQLDQGISVPVLISGPWSNVRFRPDLKGLIDKNLEAEKAKLKEKAKAEEERLKAKAEAKLKEELGVVRQDGQSAEDAVKDALEDKAKNALGKLFGR